MSLTISNTQIARAVICQNVLGESPIWSPVHQALYWIDMAKPTLWQFDPVSRSTAHWPLAKPPAVIATRQNGGLLLLFRRGFLMLDELSPGDTIPEPVPLPLDLDRLNDGKVDAAGRMWVGSLARDLQSPVGKLYLFDHDATLRQMDAGFTLSNGMGWNPQRSSMYFADTHSKTIYHYDFNVQTGTLANRRPFAVVASEGGPDGLTVDNKGNVWVAIYGAGAVHCYRPDGSLAQIIDLPTRYPTSCAFGGRDLDTLYVTSASMNMHGDAVPADGSAGSLWAITDVGYGQPESTLPY